MVAYSYQRRFVVPIAMGIKPHTIRNHRKRHVRPGEEIQHYHGMRTTSCRLIGTSKCSYVNDITLDFTAAAEYLPGNERTNDLTTAYRVRLPNVMYSEPARIDQFARLDGFDDWADLRAFWAEKHPKVVVFSGVLIDWEPEEVKLTDWGKRHRDLGFEAQADGQKLTETFVKQWIGL